MSTIGSLTERQRRAVAAQLTRTTSRAGPDRARALTHCSRREVRTEATLLFNAIRWLTYHATEAVVQPRLRPGGRHAAIRYFEPAGCVAARRHPFNRAAREQRVESGERRHAR
jgi:hypothetical protein